MIKQKTKKKNQRVKRLNGNRNLNQKRSETIVLYRVSKRTYSLKKKSIEINHGARNLCFKPLLASECKY